MNASALKLLVLSLLLLLCVSAAAFYIVYEQEQNGRLIREGLVSVSTWERLQENDPEFSETEEPVSETEVLESLVLQSESDTVGLLTFVDELARRTGVTIAATELKVVKNSEANFDNLSAAFSLRGDEESVEETIKLFELLPYRSYIETLSLTRGPAAAEAHLVVMVSVRE